LKTRGKLLSLALGAEKRFGLLRRLLLASQGKRTLKAWERFCFQTGNSACQNTGGVNRMNIPSMAHTIRLIAFSCKSKDVMSCEFGTEFDDRVRDFLMEEMEAEQTKNKE
jgi:hypothetical protein